MGQLPPPDRKGEFMLKRSAFVAAAAAALLTSSALAQAPQTESYDLLIDNGTIYDGLGGAPFTGDVAITGDRIAYVGPQAPGTAKRPSTLPEWPSRPASSTC